MTTTQQNTTTTDRILSLQEVAEIFGRSSKSIWRWHAKDKCLVPPIKIKGRTVGWRQSTIDNFLASQQTQNQ